MILKFRTFSENMKWQRWCVSIVTASAFFVFFANKNLCRSVSEKMSKVDITKLDLYGLFEVSPDASAQEIKTAYRKKALKCHPDKNPDNPEAAKLFHQLSEALKVLTDDLAKAAYDRVLRAKKETELRNRKLDSKRLKLKEELEAREKAYQTTGRTSSAPQKSPEEQLKDEIERLRKQGSQQLAEEQERIRQELAKEKVQSAAKTFSGRLKVSWKVEPDREDCYTKEKLHSILQKYGNISALIVSSKRKGSAIVEFTNKRDADLAYSVEKGLHTCPLTLSWIQGDQPTEAAKATPQPAAAPATSMADFEARVLQSMREAQERKRKLMENGSSSPSS